ncbi:MULTISPECIES: chromosome segregation protein SMC [unclassified Colwellia]|uniref:chromosome segregation protein SMC n=1 Tax=unclassified Colwellia TaxID=196834 RepID=UPI0015F73258|nr:MULTISPECIES: chromosome segregation protein SMC [unclassified Colwellia]MBA6380642.1 chromosome segregation protein SMC [Colwellia sp. BRX10-7]MBA6387987.1 chromosome segregation protein SMC [Colwellia sp. BRX10-2]MBA6402050.1 chromosome segregation protein SMC [Colwellia sp. BRX10-5]MBA6406394.1 chromosome segregation protein SMC [Colwellia sp. BRX10-1]
MRLKHIKLAGFKSFVDPTKVPFEQRMTAIVGPNGCGKSNIIDAVRWVLGESSAKNLRGDAMTDVIFNGAATRKPVGQASVELLFDNIDGRIQGNMADRNQVSIRRVINRDSQNTYYLNGSKCRRRDITDIFLGTGLGPRSYAIIEQGTISKLIESKPQELRVFIEEAAGISKYKERRRDTENRIRHTRENLERLNDIRVELGLQIDKLHQQAEAAKRFKTLKTRERKYRAELTVLKWQKFDQQANEQKQQVSQYQTEIEALIVEQKKIDIQLFDAKQKVTIGGESSGELHQQKLLLSNDIARAEQNIKHLKQQKQKAQHDNSVTQQQLINAQQLVLAEQEQLQKSTLKITEHVPELELIEQQLLESQIQLEGYIEQQRNEHQQWQALQRQHQDTNDQQLSVNQRISQLSEQISQQQQRQQSLTHLLANLTKESFSENVESTAELGNKLLKQEKHQQSLLKQYKDNESNQLVLVTQISLASKQQAQYSGEIAALKLYLQQLLTQQNQQAGWRIKQKEWLSVRGQKVLGAVFQLLTVETAWQASVELVLHHWLQGELVEYFPTEVTIEPLFLVLDQQINKTSATRSVKVTSGTLAEQVKGLPAITALLNNIFIAQDYQQAQQIMLTLADHQSVICKDGTWLSRYFLRKGSAENFDALLQLTDNISQTSKKVTELTLSIQECQDKESQLIKSKEQFVSDAKALKTAIEQSTYQVQALQQKIALAKQAAEQRDKQSTLYQQELTTLESLLSQNKKLLSVQEDALTKLPKHDAEQLMHISSAQESLQRKIQDSQESSQRFHQQKHQQALIIEKLNHEQTQGQLSLVRAQESIQQLTKQQRMHQEIVEECASPLQVDEQKLQAWLIDVAELDGKIAKIQHDTTDSKTLISDAELKVQQLTRNINSKKEQINAVHLTAESYRLRADAALEQLNEMQQSLLAVQTAMPDQAKEPLWQAHIVNLGKDINRLGAINLAAINEYQIQFERKTYLDQQDEDLTQAINTLELAIAKIDKESRHKFKNTFEKINSDLKALFPKVFGGGSAYLALTDDDMLETGVTIMARPPGKKNSTIHLLSGGEKALTALSLVFAIFRLNPAPFCMLDEVDAPLDDANVSRFCNLVREMSQTVQFIYISHNKIAMEMASQLTGVTMFEPGVSKMVAVDIDEAIAMAELE